MWAATRAAMRTLPAIDLEQRFRANETSAQKYSDSQLFKEASTSNCELSIIMTAFLHVALHLHSRIHEDARKAHVLTCTTLSFSSKAAHTHTHLRTYTLTHLHTYPLTHLHIYTLTHLHIYTFTHSHIYTFTHLHICTYIYMYMYMYMYMLHLHVHLHLHLH